MNHHSTGSPSFLLTSPRLQAGSAHSNAPEQAGRSIIKFDYCLPPALPKNAQRVRRKK